MYTLSRLAQLILDLLRLVLHSSHSPTNSTALRKVGAKPRVGDSPSAILSSPRVLVPGVGTFGAAMELLAQTGCHEALRQRVAAQRPTFFICVGLQIMACSSEESPGVAGLGIIKETITRFSNDVTVPQVRVLLIILMMKHGWNLVVPSSQSRYVKRGFAYFSNSYKLSEIPDGWSCSMSNHGGQFVAALERGNILACQVLHGGQQLIS